MKQTRINSSNKDKNIIPGNIKEISNSKPKRMRWNTLLENNSFFQMINEIHVRQTQYVE